MAELIGAVASAFAIAGAASSAASKLKNLWDEVQNVPETITDLVLQIEILESHICQIESEINKRGTSIRPIVDDSAVRLSTEYCRGCMKSLASIVDDLREKIDNQKNSKRTFAKIRVVLKKQVLAHFEKRLQGAVSLLNTTQQGYAMALIGLLTAHDIHRGSHLDALDGNIDIPATGAFQTREIGFDFADSSRREGQTSFNLSVKPNITKQPWRSWSNSLMNDTIGIHCSTRQLAPHSIPETSYSIRIHLPEWLVRSVWDFQVTKATSGWKTNLRSWRIAPDSLAIKAVKDNNYYGLRSSLVSGQGTLFDLTEAGDTLLHLAAQHANHDIIDLLLTGGLGFDDKSIGATPVLRKFVHHLQQQGTRAWPAYLFDILDFLTSQGAFENMISNWEVSINCIGAPMLSVINFQGALDVTDALMIWQTYVVPGLRDLAPSIPSVFTVAPGDWSPQSVRIHIWKDGRSHQCSLSGAMADGLPIWTLLAYFMGTSESLSDDANNQEWRNALQDVSGITGSDSLHRQVDVPGFQPWFLQTPETPLTPLLWLLLLALDSWHARGYPQTSFEEIYSSYLLPTLQRWLRLLKSYGVDLKEYGDHEQNILQGNPSILSYDWKFSHGCDVGENVRLRNITRGVNVEDWGLTWNTKSSRDDIEEVVCESPISVPGGWPDEDPNTRSE